MNHLRGQASTEKMTDRRRLRLGRQRSAADAESAVAAKPPRLVASWSWMWPACAVGIPVLLAVMLTYPLILDMPHRVVGWPGDNLNLVWWMHWAEYTLLNEKPFYTDPGAFYPVGFSVTETSISEINIIAALPVTILFGPVTAYNVILFATYALTSLCTYLWLKELTHNKAIALVCGVISAFFPYRFAHLPGHLDSLSTQWFPLGFWAIERYVRSRHVKWAVLIGVCIALAALSHWYFLIFSSLAFSLYVVVRFTRFRKRQTSAKPWLTVRCALRDMIVAGTVAALLIAPFFIPHIQMELQSGNTWRSLATLFGLSMNPLDFVMPSVRSPIFGQWAASLYPAGLTQNFVEAVVTPGLILTLLALSGIALSRRRSIVRALLVITIVFTVLAMGPVLVARDRSPVRITVQESTMIWLDSSGIMGFLGEWFGRDLAADMKANRYLVIPLPYALIYKLPGIRSIRAVGRFGILMNFALCGLCSLGLASWWKRLKRIPCCVRSVRMRYWMVAAIGVLVLLEYWQIPYGITRMIDRPVDVWLSQQPQAVVLDIPQRKNVSLYGRTIHNQLSPLGVEDQAGVAFARNNSIQALPSESSMQDLCAWKVTYIIIDPSLAGQQRATQLQNAFAGRTDIHFQYQIGNALVYHMDPCLPDKG